MSEEISAKIAALEALRATLGDAATDAAITTLKAGGREINTGGSASIAGTVQTSGDFVGGDIISVGNISGVGIAIGSNATAVIIRQSLHNIPPAPAYFTGREQEIAKIMSEARGKVQLVNLSGQGGVGKTALALQLAKSLTPSFPDAQLYLDLKGGSSQPLSSAEVMASVVQTFHPDDRLPSVDAELAALYRSSLAGKRVLLIMDNATNTRQVDALIPPSGCLLICTSRSRSVGRSSLNLSLGALPRMDAIRLLRRLAPQLGDQIELATRIAELCEGMPLALRLVGGLLANRPDLHVAESSQLLIEAVSRMSVVDATLDLSYRLRPAQDRQLIHTLVVFPDTFDVRAVAIVWDRDEDTAQALLVQLRAAGLVEWNEPARRYSLHDLVRQFIAPRLKGEERRLAQWRHAAYYLNILDSIEQRFNRGGFELRHSLDLFDLEWPNIQAGQAWSADNLMTDDDAVQLCSAYALTGTSVLEARRHALERKEWLESALEAARRLQDHRVEVAHLSNLGLVHEDLGDAHLAINYYHQALEIATVSDDPVNRAKTLGNLGNALSAIGNYREAIKSYEEALAVHRLLGERRGEGIVVGNLGVAYRSLGDLQRAIDCFQQALAIDQEIGDGLGEGNALGNLGNVYAALGETRRAIEYYTRALENKRTIGDRRGESIALSNIGLGYTDLGDYHQAIDSFETAIGIARELGDRRSEGNTLNNLGAVYTAMGELSRALVYYEQYLEIAREIGDRRGEANSLGNLGLVLESQNVTNKAIEYHRQALEIYREIGDLNGEGKVLGNLGHAYAARNDPQAAIPVYEATLRILRTLGDLRGQQMRLAELADVYHGAGQSAQAIECYEQVLEISRQIGDRVMDERALTYLSLTHSTLGNTEKATVYYQQALEIARDNGDNAHIAEILLALGTISRNVGQLEQAKRYWIESRQIYAQLRMPHEASVSSLLTDLENKHRELFSFQEIACTYLQAAGFDLDTSADPTLFQCHPRDPVWQKYFTDSIPVKIMSGVALDLDGVIALFHDARDLLGKNPHWLFIIYDRAPTDGAWLQIGAMRDKGVQIMPIDDTILSTGRQKSRQRGELFDYLEERFLGPRRDLYDRQNPISDRLNFFGREQLAQQLMENLMHGNALALFGLRKMGKSSLLNYLRNKLPCPVSLVDLQAGVELRGVYQRILDDWGRSIRAKVPDLEWQPPQIAKTRDPSSAFAAAVLGLLNHLEGRGSAEHLVLLVDEIEWIVPRHRQGLNSYLAFAGALRGIAQERVDHLGLVIAGVDPAIVRTNRLAGQQNPFYNFFREEYLQPLNREDCIQMIRNIGLQMGLSYTDEAVAFVAEISGGHPYWARKLCSLALQSWDGANRFTLEDLHIAAQRFVQEPGTAQLLDERGLWGEITDPHLWPKTQISANEHILLSLSEVERRRKEELLTRTTQQTSYNTSLYELNRRSILGKPEEDLYWIQLRLFRNWIRSDKLGEE